MSLLRKIIFGLAGIVVLFVAVGLLLPKEYEVSRSIVIDAEPAEIYPSVVDLKQWSSWGVWFQRDPNMQIEYGGPDRAIGMYSKWQSATQGSGEMEITELKHNKQVEYSLWFPEYDMGSTGRITLETTPEGTRVIWRDSGEVGANPVDRYLVLMIDNMMGPDFETGLENLKTVVENQG
ncbi:SRPBCC family protein [Salinimonas sp. HHU 13199]|uniref:SRPBCC family protein n=1 Tax=Salinimonas profundi TaxID=2729140 RepID=A0ABR8LEZ5_9ALTE|nr:SRPBCC family protein [Salinimonas profundi]MBD3584836.1 SRPBCC family protein [Salinimonas profundi]